MFPQWVKKYIGIPFVERACGYDGCDCYGLIRLIYREEYKINLPDYTQKYITTKDGCTINDLISHESVKWERVREKRMGDVILCRVKGLIWHIGLLVSEDKMLHTEVMTDACIEEFNSIRWKNRVEGFYHYNGR